MPLAAFRIVSETMSEVADIEQRGNHTLDLVVGGAVWSNAHPIPKVAMLKFLLPRRRVAHHFEYEMFKVRNIDAQPNVNQWPPQIH
jgi:hypothetical protein